MTLRSLWDMGHVFHERWSSLPLGIGAQAFVFPTLPGLPIFPWNEKDAQDETLLQGEDFEKWDDLLIDRHEQNDLIR